MARSRTVWAVAVLAFMPVASYGAATKSTQLTTDGRSGGGIFSPSADTVAYYRFTKKVIAPNGTYGFEVAVCMRAEGRDRELCRLAPELPAGGRWVTRTAMPRLHWLPSGRYIVANALGPGLRLLATDGSLDTRAGRGGEWFVVNDPAPLDKDDAGALNRWLHDERRVNREICAPWLYSPTGQYRGAGFLRTKDLPAATSDWFFESGSSSPDGRFAAFTMADRHFGGCSCCSGSQDTHLGQLDRATGAFTQLTFTSRNRQVQPLWSPDAKWIAYQRQEKGGGPGEPPTRLDLWVMRRDGWDDRPLAPNVSYGYQWLNDEWIAYRTSDWPDGEAQVGIVNARTGAGQLLTKGHFRHELSDYRDSRFLIEEHPAGLSDWRTTPAWQYTSNLYVIEPLRVAM